MEMLRWMQIFALLYGYSCAVVPADDLKPLELPPGYETKLKTVLPEILQQAGIPAALIPSADGLVASSLSKLSNGFDYLQFGADSENKGKSKLCLYS